MQGYCKVILIGNVTRDIELRYTPKGTAVTEIGLAVNRVYNTEDGEKKEEVTFVDITFWAKQAEIVHRYTKKGSPIFVEGRLQLDTWDDKQTGQKRSKLRVVAENIQLLGTKESGQGTSTPSRRPSEPKASAPRDPDLDPSAEPDDIPFLTTVYKDVRNNRLNRRIF